MTNLLYKYVQSSCPCFVNNTGTNYDIKNGNPSNLAISSCKYPDIFECNNNFIFKQNIEPTDNHVTKWINPNVYTSKTALDFGSINNTSDSTCQPTQYLSADPRLTSAIRGSRMTLDRPPIDSTIKLKDIYDEKIKSSGQNYSSYNDINYGDIIYYTTNDDAFYKPLFSNPAHTISTLYKDPMDNIIPEYTRIPLEKQNNPITTLNNEDNDGYHLSWIKDSQNHREDLLSLQMQKSRNKNRWSPRWTNEQTNVLQSVPDAYDCS